MATATVNDYSIIGGKKGVEISDAGNVKESKIKGRKRYLR